MTYSEKEKEVKTEIENKKSIGSLVRTSKGVGRVVDILNRFERTYLFVVIGGETEARMFRTTRCKAIRK